MKKNKKLLDYIGAGCGVFLVLVLLISIISNIVASAPPKGAVTLTGTAPGRNADVAVEVVTDGSQIVGISVTSHEETEGIGTMAVEQLPPAILEANSLAVDNISGATITSEAIKAAVANALTEGGFDPSVFGFVAPAAEEPAPAAAPAEETPVETSEDGKVTATGAGKGIDGDVVVQVTADAKHIYEVEVLEQNETVGIGSVAVEKLPGAIVEANSLAIDGIAGATVTSTAIKDGVREALTKAGLDAEYFESVHEEAPADAQTLTGAGKGIDGDVVVQVTADAEHIYDVQVLEQNETVGIGSVAVEKLPGAIVEANSLAVDGIAGATITSTAIKDGIREALASGGIDAAYFEELHEAAEEAPAEKDEVTLECDVVVVGAGGAGLTAAVRATQEGAKVLVVEKMPLVGGNSLRAEGGMNAADTKVQAELGLDDSTVDNFVADTLRLGHDLANPDLVRTLAENSAEAVDWLDSIGAPLTKVAATGGTEHKYLHKPEDGRPVGSYLVEKLSACAEDLGIEIMLNTKATEILMSGERACGIKAEGEEHNYIINAKAVVIATGGFGSNFELMASYDPSLADAVTTNHAGAQGDGIKMAQAVGADTVDMEQIQLHPTVIQQNGLLVSESVRSHGAILVNAEGKRFVNDMAGRDVVSQAELKQPGAYAYIVFDQGLVDEVALTKKFIDGGYALIGESYEELAQAMGLEGDAIANFVETMENWNAYVAAGEDKDFGRSAVSMIDISTAPYYAIKIAPGIHHTMGGIKIDTKAQVINTEGEVIAGLFAAGETTGGIHGGNRVGGNAVCDFIVFGRIAGSSAAEYAAAIAPAAFSSQATALTGAGKGIGGDVVVEVTADAEHIYDVQVLEQNETVGIGSVAVEKLPGAIVEANSLAVDGIAGATITSTAIKDGIREALASGGIDAAYFEEFHEAEEAAETDAQTLTGAGKGIGGDVVVEVTADAEHIYDVQVLEQNETVGIGSVAVEKLPGAIVEANSLAVDGIAGATVTSTAIKDGIREALASGGIDAAYFEEFHEAEEAAEEAAEEEAEAYDCDVVVIGAGGAGMSAAITATDAGMKVIVVESQAMVGGNSVRSTGGMNAAPTEWRNMNEFGESAGVENTLAKADKYVDNERIQELAAAVAEQWAEYQADPEGYFDTVELFQLDTLIGGGGLNDPDLVRTLAERSADAIDWLGGLDPEVILHNVAQFGGASVKRIHRPVDENGKTLSVGAYVVPLLQQNLEKRGVEVLLETTATEILREEDGPVTGILCTDAAGKTIRINAKAVVIASGGFGANNDMIASVRPELDGFITTNAPGVQGQGIQMAQAVGADTVDLEQIQLHPTVHVEGTAAVLITEGLRGDGAILVNQEGERFFDEVSTRDKVSAAEFEQTGGYAWLIVDSRMSDASNVIQGYINKGYAVSGETWEELAEAIGAPAETLAATMEKWNACVEAKEDADFGRVSFAAPLDQAPFYAIKVQPGVHHTMGGIKINSEAQVIDTEGAVIPALFAAGETTGGVHGNNRLGGNAVADFVIFGRIAGSSAAEYACGGAEPAEAEEAAEEAEEPTETGGLTDGEYTAAAESLLNFENVYVTIVVEGGKIVSVDVDTSSQSSDIGAAAEPQYEEQIMAAQGGEIDGVSGATVTSLAVKEAYEDVLKQAA